MSFQKHPDEHAPTKAWARNLTLQYQCNLVSIQYMQVLANLRICKPSQAPGRASGSKNRF